MEKIIINEGVNESERSLGYFSNKSFFSLWGFLNVFFPKGKQIKELCDLLVVFGETVIIFSDKNFKYSTEADENVAWERWKKKTIIKSVDQLIGAADRIREYPNDLYHDRQCRQNFYLDVNNIQHINMIAILKGLPENINIITTNFQTDKYYHINCNQNNNFVHFFTDKTIYYLLSTLDTISDFVEYINFRKKLLSSNKETTIDSEKIIVSLFYVYRDNQEEFFLNLPTIGELEFISSNPEYNFLNRSPNNKKLEIKTGKLSGLNIIDKLISDFSELTVNAEVLDFGTNQNINNHEKRIRYLADLNRRERNALSDSIKQAINSVVLGKWWLRHVFLRNNRIYVILVFPYHSQDWESVSKYRDYRRILLSQCCLCSLADYPGTQVSVGIAIQRYNMESGVSSEDLCAIERKNTDKKTIYWASKTRKEYNINRKEQRTQTKITSIL